MNRRAFLSALGFASVPAAIVATPSAQPASPLTRATVFCPSCSQCMQIVTRSWEKAHPNDPDVWSCDRCERSWRIAHQPLPATEVIYDSGVRQRA